MKKTYTTIALVAIFGLLLSPIASFAQGPENRPKSRPEERKDGANFCTMIQNESKKISNFSDKIEKMKSRRAGVKEKIEEKRLAHHVWRAEKRTAWENRHEDRFEKIDELAKTDEQKQGLIEFKESIETAIEERKDSFESAKTTFQLAIDDLHEARKSTIDTILEDLHNARQDALEKAKTDCENGVDPKTVREDFQNTLSTLKETAKTSRQELQTKPDISELVKTRKAALDEAITTFKDAVKEAQEKLKSLFPKDSPDEEDEDESE